MIKRFGSIMLCLLSIIYSSCLIAELGPYKWTLNKGDIVEHEGSISLIKNKRRTYQPAVSGASCGDNDSDCYSECHCGCESSGSAFYSEDFTLNTDFNHDQNQPHAVIPSVFRPLVGEGNGGFHRRYILNYGMDGPSTTVHNIAAFFWCFFCSPCYCYYLKREEESHRRNRASANQGLQAASPANLPNGISITSRQLVYINRETDRSYAGEPFNVPSSAGTIINLFLNNSEAQNWLRPYLDRLPSGQTNSQTVMLRGNVWIPELAETPMFANIQIQRHTQFLFLQPQAGQLLYPTHHMRLDFPNNNNMTVEYHIFYEPNQAARVLGVIITQGEYSLRVEQHGYESDYYRMQSSYEPVQSMNQRPDIQHRTGGHFPYPPDPGSL